MTLTKETKFAIAALFVLSIIIFFLSRSGVTKAESIPGVPASIATTTNLSVGPAATLAIASTTNSSGSPATCASRIISTGSSAVMLTFTDKQGQSPTGLFGYWQAASTTVAYDSGLYGCDAVKVYSYTAQNITVSEAR